MDKPTINLNSAIALAKSWLGLLCALLILLVATGFSYYFLLSIQKQSANQQQIDIALAQAKLLPNIIQQQLQNYQRNVKGVFLQQESIALVQQLAKGDTVFANLGPVQLSWLQAKAANIHLAGKAQRDPNTQPPITFVGLELIKSAEASDAVSVEALKVNKKWQLLLSYSLRENKSAIATILASFDLSPLRDSLRQHIKQQGSLQLMQKIGDAKAQVIIQIGQTDNTANKVEFATANPNWTVHFYPSQKTATLEPIVSTSQVMTLWSVIVIALILTIAVPWIISQRQLHHDAELIGQYVASMLHGASTDNPKLQHPSLHSLIEKIQDLSGDFSTTLVQVKAAPSQPMKANKDEDFSLIDDLELDPSDTKLLAIADADISAQKQKDAVNPEPESAQSKQIATNNVTQTIDKVEQKVGINREIFRAYDIRGIIGESLTIADAEIIGLAIATRAQQLKIQSLVVAADGRESSPELCKSLIRGVRKGGLDVIHIGMVATPLMYFATETLETNSGVMVTGSHNPANHNGFKIVLNGAALAEQEIQLLYDIIQQQNFSQGRGGLSELDVEEAYINRITSDIAIAQPLRIVIDCGNGVSGKTAPKLFQAIGCEVIELFTEVDGSFPNHHPDPSKPENLQDLIQGVNEHQADIGIAFDGDGDRLGVVTESGNIIWPDRLLMLFAKDIVSRNPGADVIYDVKCTRLLNAFISGYGGRPIMWKTGHSLIKAKMRETGALLGGEMSGHIFIKERWYGFDDGLYSAARLLEILSTESRTADMLFDAFPNSVATPEINIAIDESEKFSTVESLIANCQWSDGNINTLDGLRVDFSDGWGLVRASNTTANLVLRFEADNEEALARIQQLFYTQLQNQNPQISIPA